MRSPNPDSIYLKPITGGPAQQLVVLLHGYGANGHDLISLGRSWSEILPNAAFIAPNAPDPLPFEALSGRQWFALSEHDMREYRLGVEAARSALDTFLDAQLEFWGVDASELALAGFSQGAMMALHTGLRRTIPPAAILAYSGLLAGPDQQEGITTKTPVLMVHGAEDDVVPPYHLPISRDAMVRAGIQVEYHLLDDLDHSIDERGMVLGGRFLKTAFSATTAG